jgi:hypothetical protein
MTAGVAKLFRQRGNNSEDGRATWGTAVAGGGSHSEGGYHITDYRPTVMTPVGR